MNGFRPDGNIFADHDGAPDKQPGWHNGAMSFRASFFLTLSALGFAGALFGQAEEEAAPKTSRTGDYINSAPLYDIVSGKSQPQAGECGPVRYRARWEKSPSDVGTQIELLNHRDRVLKRVSVDNVLDEVRCTHHAVKGVKTLEFYFAEGGSGLRVDWLVYRVNPFSPLLQISLETHDDLYSVEFKDLDHDGQNEVIVRNGDLGFALCKSCDYDADTVEYLLCYRDGKFHECAREHPEYFRELIEKGFKKLADPRQRRHRLAWSLYILFHAEEIGEADGAWTRLQSALPGDFIGKVESRRARVARALRRRDANWRSH